MLVDTIYGPMDSSDLTLRTPKEETDEYYADATEYYIGEELVHRSVHVTMKIGTIVGSIAGEL